MMPTILRSGKLRYFFFSNERSEPRHAHVEEGDHYAKIWLDSVTIAKSSGFSGPELNRIKLFVLEHAEFFKEKWDAYFGRESC